MKLIDELRPRWRLSSVAELTPAWLAEHKIEGIIFDIDNTLVPQDASVNTATRRLFAQLQAAGIRIFVLSNNTGTHRVQDFCGALHCPWLHRAKKPSRLGFLKAAAIMELPLNKIVAVGDQLFTDVRGANRAGISSLLVTPLRKKENWGVRLFRRPLEKLAFAYMARCEEKVKNPTKKDEKNS